MENLKKYIEEIKSFDFNHFENEMIKSKKTQLAAELTENFIEKQTLKHFPDSIVLKAGSQQYPDFIIISKEIFEKEFPEELKSTILKKVSKGISATNDVIRWSEKNNKKSLILFVEVKSGKNNLYQCNDSFPNPLHDYVYFMFDRKNKEVHISTSAKMAETEMLIGNIDIYEKYKEDKNQVRELRTTKKEEWKLVGVHSTPRMTYSIKSSYAHASISIEELNQIFKKANFK